MAEPVLAEQTFHVARGQRFAHVAAAVLGALHPSGAGRVLEIGCGTGELLFELVEQRPGIEVVGRSLHARHRAVEFKKFLARLDPEVPAECRCS